MMVVDAHSHILPGVDDGSRDVAQSLQMLEAQARQGITHVLATPHFYPRYSNPDRFLTKRSQAQQILEAALADRTDLPKLIVGAEVHYFPGMGESEHLKKLTIGDTRLILVEMPEPPWTQGEYRDLENIYICQGLTPIIAHIDRYIRPFHTYGIVKRLEQLPVLVQANSEFFLNKATQRMAFHMLKKGQIHLLGSDCHNMSDRAPDLGEAQKLIVRKLGRSALTKIRETEAHCFGK